MERAAENARIGNKQSLTFAHFEDLCDDPARDQPGGANIYAILTYVPEKGFSLSALDGDNTHEITDGVGRRIRFRTIEAAVAALQNVPGLSPEIWLWQDRNR